MADISTHIYFASLLLKALKEDINDIDYFVGAVAADCIKEDDLFNEHHLLDQDKCIRIEALRDFAKGTQNSKNKSFHLGYLSHLYLDYYYEAYKEEIYLFGLATKDEKIKAMTEIRRFNHHLKMGPDSLDLTDLPKSEFAYIEKAYKILIDYLLTSRLATEAAAPQKYVQLMENVKKKFMTEGFQYDDSQQIRVTNDD